MEDGRRDLCLMAARCSGYGYLKDYAIERCECERNSSSRLRDATCSDLRDARVHRILEGTDNIMRLIVARDLLALKQT
jgi:alkylation response protein AidB-like acyl-CoA dehydrogenase